MFLPITMHKFISVMNTVLSDVTPCKLVADADISEIPVVTTLRVDETGRLILSLHQTIRLLADHGGCAV